MQMGIRKKIFSGFLIICLILFLSGIVAMFEISRLQRSVSGILSKKVETIVALHNVEATMVEQVSVLLYALHEDPSLLEVVENMKKIEGYLSVIRKNELAGEDSSIARLEQLLNDFETQLKEQHTYLWNDNYGIRRAWYAENLYPLFFAIREEMEILIHKNNIALETTSAEIESGFYRSNIPAVIAVITGIVLVLLFYYFVNLYFISPILRIKQGIRKYMELHVRYTVEVEGTDELGELNTAVKELTEAHKSSTKE
jgi:methyl-accepting chemotaxis protein